MHKMIVMTAAQAAAVTGMSSPGHHLEPRPLKDGRFAVNTRVLSSPHHATKHATLAGYPVEEIGADDFAQED